MEIKDLVKQAVNRVNTDAIEKTEQRVRQLVNAILESEANIIRLHENVTECKRELRALQIPGVVSVEI